MDPRTPLGPLDRVIRDGIMVLEQLAALDSMPSALLAIDALDERGRRAALMAAIMRARAAAGETSDEIGAWTRRGWEQLG